MATAWRPPGGEEMGTNDGFKKENNISQRSLKDSVGWWWGREGERHCFVHGGTFGLDVPLE